MTCSQHHALADAELHFARCQIRNHDGVFADQVFGFVGAGDAAEDVARLAFTHIERQAQQLDRAINCFAIDDFGDPQVDFGEVVNGDGGC